MESRAFIRDAQALIKKIKDHALLSITQQDDRASKEAIQKEITQMFTGLSNPTLPSASKLCSTALSAGFTVKPNIQHRLTQAESCWAGGWGP
jgi:hypothetical protein